MTELETIKILEMLSAFYAGGKNDPKQQVVAWHMILHEYDFSEAMDAVLHFAKNDTRQYATFPAVGKIVEQIRLAKHRREQTITEIIRSVGYGRQYADLSGEAKALIPEESYQKWLDVDATEFSEKQTKFAEFLRNRRLQLEASA